jgi:hypothetical protein
MGGLPSSYLNLLKLPWLKSFLLSKPLNFKEKEYIVTLSAQYTPLIIITN